ncbi:ABC transporter ATP-binding protein [Mycoplasmopsis alligatoris]|uniref:ABC transporter, ATP-binding protein n=1 Tax=Mycoplasmopsis alligatoris A21JP2 TaxID=747682 RepID=D4XW90_9BACT|nr:ABC transporter ATP-binding protein [Mycoplasmopsis alligatoris]EFF41399.1 ABC transporter, ATP-binding protein [Mycoplasmopsis alligatoris A21JP2]
MNKKIAQIIDFSKSYAKNDYAVKNINFDIYAGKFHAFIGSNGAGKTTTIKALVNAYEKWEGKILINNIENHYAQAKYKLGYMPENPIFPSNFTSYDYLYSFALLSGQKKDQAQENIKTLSDNLKIEELLYKKPHNFSSGQKKKILLAQSLINNPDLLVMDEPAANLDPNAREELFSVLNSLKDKGKTIFISTHELHEISRFVDFVTIIDKGTLIYTGEFKQDSKCDLNQFYFLKIKEFYDKKI